MKPEHANFHIQHLKVDYKQHDTSYFLSTILLLQRKSNKMQRQCRLYQEKWNDYFKYGFSLVAIIFSQICFSTRHY